MKKKLLLVTLFAVAFLERTFFDLGPNFELVTMAMILTSYYFGKKETFWLTFAIIATTDRLIGNSSIFLFTWSGFLIPAILSSNLIKRLILRLKFRPACAGRLFSILSIGLVSNLFFYFWTNFGVWFLDSWDMYSNNFTGLMMSYVNALPFLKYQLTSTLIFVPLGYFSIELVKAIYKRLQPRLASQSLI